MSIPNLPDYPNDLDLSIFTSDFIWDKWSFTDSASRCASMIRSLLNHCPDVVQVFILLAFAFFVFGLFFRLLKELL